ncbi:hypothetical protein WH52_00485 [Tenacibaculum holothuriorum]|uniref:DUF1853 domain-containing protein n=1 Tax=Tenacibaculum holothuriorum TaxID=1635173 RepID=A0A1Y2PHH9_9FLAO|nr:DUF1853 family protein [Tenacibaculum holothuriorum]OSY89169.1 hypothetical protein WH52_00485 [Tenacibaculum holothuriorum]
MHQKQKDLQLQYEGFLKTPFLWHGKGVFDLIQFETVSNKTSTFSQTINKKLRLGKLVERFVSQELQQDNSVDVLAENIQIQNDKITLGELDCLLTKDNVPTHLEIIYKFYLYDESVGSSEVDHWIGPNRRDSLLQKLTKLKEKQLPLLYSNYSKPYLNELNLNSSTIKQQVYFKAQLFIPLKKQEQFSTSLNNNCVYGFYIYPKQLKLFSSCKFYIPNKLDWLVEPHSNINWSNFENFKNDVEKYLLQENAPLCWMKKQNGEVIKFFVVWWS